MMEVTGNEAQSLITPLKSKADVKMVEASQG
jgi:hypothetical protein